MNPATCSSCSAKDGNIKPHSPKPQATPSLFSTGSIKHDDRTVQKPPKAEQSFSFEEPPVNETWYSAFTRTEIAILPYSAFVNPLDKPPVLPYEVDRATLTPRSTPARNSRKSRSNASTPATLSSERPTRRTRRSVTIDTVPSANINNLPSESTVEALLLPPAELHPVPSTSSTSLPTLSSPPKYIPGAIIRRPNPSSPEPNHNDSKNELNDDQYLWDSIQYLSDPYVVALLAGQDPEGASKEQQQDNFESTEENASLRSENGSVASVNNTENSNSVPNSGLASLSKSSPRNQSQDINHISGTKITSPPVFPSAAVNDNISGVKRTNRFLRFSSPFSPPSKDGVFPMRPSPKNSTSTHIKQSEASKSYGDGSEASVNTTGNSNSVPDSGLAPVSKSSPRNLSQGINHISGTKITSPPVSPSAAVNDNISGVKRTNRFLRFSPPLSPSSQQGVFPMRPSPKNSTSNHIKQSEASKSYGDGSEASVNTTGNSNSVPDSGLASVSNSSPRNQYDGTNNNGAHKITSPPVSPSAAVNDSIYGEKLTKRFRKRSPPLSPIARQTVVAMTLSPKKSKNAYTKQSEPVQGSGSEGDVELVVSPEKSTEDIVVEADLCTAMDKTKIKSWEEESFFIGDGLPPLPYWPAQ